jgi:16S rRNA (uracil1498-N3)-methyltransferase
VSLFIGPEGGYADEEIALAQASGAVLVTLGRQVLRSETAGVVAAAIVLHTLDV